MCSRAALPDGYRPEHVAPALAAKVETLPEALRRSLTWDQGPRDGDWKQVHVDAGIDELNTRSRQRLDFANPTEQAADLLLQ